MAIYEICLNPSLSYSLRLISHLMTLYLSLSSITGTAIRHCDEHRGWLPPNLFNCTSVTFSKLKALVCSSCLCHHAALTTSVQEYSELCGAQWC